MLKEFLNGNAIMKGKIMLRDSAEADTLERRYLIMKDQFEIIIQETLERTIKVESPSREAAEHIVRQRWKDSAYALGASDSVCVTFRHRKAPELCSAR